MASVHAAPPEIQLGLDRLAAWLAGEGYGPEPTGRILDYVIADGTPTGAPDLDPGDEEWAEAEYCLGLESTPEPQTSPAWDEYRYWPGQGPIYQSTGSDWLLDQLAYGLDRLCRRAELAAAAIMPPELEDGLEPEPGPEPEPWAEMMATMPPIAGGAPEEPVDPTWPRPWRSAAELERWTRRSLTR